jgi:hypothetical protein
VQLLRRGIWGSRGSSGSESRKPSRSNTTLARVHISSYIAADSVGGIIRAHSLSPGGAHPPGDDIQSFQSPIFSPLVISSSLEAKALSLRQFPGDSVKYSHQGEFSGVAAVVVSFQNYIFLLIYPCMRRSFC